MYVLMHVCVFVCTCEGLLRAKFECTQYVCMYVRIHTYTRIHTGQYVCTPTYTNKDTHMQTKTYILDAQASGQGL